MLDTVLDVVPTGAAWHRAHDAADPAADHRRTAATLRDFFARPPSPA